MTNQRENDNSQAFPWRWIAGLCVFFIVVHLGYYAAGFRFNRDTLIEVMHFLDPALLQTRLLESLWYLHIQPPLMNAAVGLLLKISPNGTGLFQAVYLAFGTLLYLCTFLLQWRLGVRLWVAATLSSLFLASPSFLLWENILLYTLPSAALLALAALLFFEVLERGRPIAIAGFWAALFCLCGIRSMFHLTYFLLVFAAMIWAGRKHRKRIGLIGVLPLALLLSFYVKNLIVFGEFSVCTFSDKNLWIMTAGNINGVEKVRLVNEGKLSRLSLVNRWASLDAYPPEYREVPERFRGIPALSDTHKSTGAVNYNHYGNIAICKEYGRDARYVLRHYPRAYLNAVALSAYRYFISSSNLPVAPQNKVRIPRMIAFCDYVFYGKWPFDFPAYSRLVEKTGQPVFLFLLLGLPLVFVHGAYCALRKRSGFSRSQRLTLLFLCFNILFVFTLGCALDFLETARYRFMTDGLSIALLGVFLERLLARRKEEPGGQERPPGSY